MPTSFYKLGESLGELIESSEVKELVGGLSESDANAVMEWIENNIRCRTANDADYELEWK